MKIVKKILLCVCILSLVLLCSCQSSGLKEAGWEDGVKENLNAFISEYGNLQDGKAYVVFDWDNTCVINDINYSSLAFMLTHMAFKLDPSQIGSALATDLDSADPNVSAYVSDISNAYAYLYNKYGPFNAYGLEDDASDEIQKDNYWQEFAGKYLSLKDYVYKKVSPEIAYAWFDYGWTGCTKDEMYTFGKRALDYYKDVETSNITVESPSSITSSVGQVKSSMSVGVSVTPNVKELISQLSKANIQVWIDSASAMELVRAAVDVYGLHDFVAGEIGLVFKYDQSGQMLPAVDLENGCGYVKNGNDFVADNLPIRAITEGKGKANAIQNVIVPKYGCGPLAGFMDNNGDFNFCSEFDSLKLVVCFNTGKRAVTNGAGLIAEIAMYQKDTLHYDLKTANAAGDTLYLLQGRDENGLRSLRNSNASILLGKSEEKLFNNEENNKQLQYITDHHMSTTDALNTLSIKNSNGWGFLNNYAGYHNIKL